MLAHILAVSVGMGSVGLYLAAFFLPDIHRKSDFIWSGVGLFYALTLWIYARQESGGILVGQIASVALLGWLGWQTFILRRQLVPVSQQKPIPSTTKPPEKLGLDRSTAKPPQPTAKTAPPVVTTPAPSPSVQPPPSPKTAPVPHVPQPSVPSPSVQPPSSPKTAPVPSVPQPSFSTPSVQPSPTPKTVPVPNVPQPSVSTPSIQPSPTLKTAPVESKLPANTRLAPQPPSSNNDAVEPTLGVDVVEATDKAWIELKVRSAPAPKPLGTAAKPPTPTSPTMSNPQPQPLLPSSTEDRSTISPAEPIAATIRSAAEDRE